MMNYKEQMDLSYQYFITNAPEVDNPHLDKTKPQVEQLVLCQCFARFRVYVNGSGPIADIKMIDVFCHHCKTPAENYIMISGHSAGCFNASVSRTR